MERGDGFEPTHPRVEALVHSLSYVTPACLAYPICFGGYDRAYCMKKRAKVKKIPEERVFLIGKWRREGDSNSRWVAPHTLSKGAH